MPPKAKITREMVLATVLDITREAGFEAVNARSIAARLHCSTRPVFTCWENMDGLKADFLEYGYGYFERFVARWAREKGALAAGSDGGAKAEAARADERGPGDGPNVVARTGFPAGQGASVPDCLPTQAQGEEKGASPAHARAGGETQADAAPRANPAPPAEGNKEGAFPAVSQTGPGSKRGVAPQTGFSVHGPGLQTGSGDPGPETDPGPEKSAPGQGNPASPLALALMFPLSYIAFAREEPNLFKLLFISDMALRMAREADFYREAGNERRAAAFSRALGLGTEEGRQVFLNLFLYTHGIGVLTATQKVLFDEDTAKTMVENLLASLLGRATQPDGPVFPAKTNM